MGRRDQAKSAPREEKGRVFLIVWKRLKIGVIYLSENELIIYKKCIILDLTFVKNNNIIVGKMKNNLAS